VDASTTSKVWPSGLALVLGVSTGATLSLAKSRTRTMTAFCGGWKVHL
jgi:hypothetical protein